MKNQVCFSELYDLPDSKLENLISIACPKSVDFADIYLEYSQSESWSLEDGIVKSGSSNIDGGVGIRSIVGERTGFAYSNSFDYEDLSKAATMAKSIAKQGTEEKKKIQSVIGYKKLYESESPIDCMSESIKVSFLKKIDKYVRSKDNRVEQVIVNIAASHTSMMVVNSDGLKASDLRPLVRLSLIHI